MNGRVLSKKQLQVLRGNNTMEMKLDHLGAGVFTISSSAIDPKLYLMPGLQGSKPDQSFQLISLIIRKGIFTSL
jgi:hypothetical protein